MNKETHLNWLEFVFENKDKFEKLDVFYKSYDDYSFEFYSRNPNSKKIRENYNFFKMFKEKFPITSTFLKCKNQITKKLLIKDLNDLFILHDKFETSLKEYTILIDSHSYVGEKNSNTFDHLFKYKNEFINFEQLIYRLVYDSFSVTNLKSDYNFESKFQTLLQHKELLSSDTIKLISNNTKDSFMSQLYSTMIVPDRIIPDFDKFDLDVDFDYSQYSESFKFIDSMSKRFEKELLSIMKNNKKFNTLINHDVFFGFAVEHFNRLVDNWLRFISDKNNTIQSKPLSQQQKLANKLSVFLNKVSPQYLKNLLIDRIDSDVIHFMVNNTDVSSELMMKLTKHIEIFEI